MSTETAPLSHLAEPPYRASRQKPLLAGAEFLIAGLWVAGAVRYWFNSGSFALALLLAALLLLLPRAISIAFQFASAPRDYTPALWVYLLGLFLPEHMLGIARLLMPHMLPLLLAGVCLLAQTFASRLTKLESHLKPAILLTGFTVIYFVVATVLAVDKLRSFGYVGQDIGYFMQCLYTGLHGKLFSANQYHDLLYTHTVTSDFAGHNQPVLFLLLPIYWAIPHAETLFVVRNVCLALSAYPAYQLARYRLAPLSAALLTVAFLLAPAILFQNFYDYAPLSMAGLPLLFALLFYYRNNWAPYVASLLLCLFVREDLVLVVLGMSVVAFLARRRPKWYIAPFVIGTGWGIFTWFFLLPHFQHGAVSAVESCFAYLGTTPSTMAREALLHPSLILTHNAIVYLKQIFTPFGDALPFFSPVGVLSLPFLLINLLGNPGCNSAIVFRHYSLIPSILLFPGTVIALRWMGSRTSFNRLAPSLVAFTLLLASTGISLLSVGDVELGWWHSANWQQEARKVAASLPTAAAVAVPRYMLPLTANRDQVYQSLRLLDYHHPDAEYIVVDRNLQRMGVTPVWQDHYDILLAQLQDTRRFVPTYSSGNYIVYHLIGRPLSSLRPEVTGP